MKEFVPRIRELKVFTEIASDLQTRFVLDGSLAQAVLEYCLECKAQEDRGVAAPEASLFSILPALADIDILCEVGMAPKLHAEFRARLPLSMFFHFEFRAIDGSDRDLYAKSGNLEIHGMPRIEFLPSKKSQSDAQANLSLRLGSEKELVVTEPSSPPETRIHWRGGSGGRPIKGDAGALLDLHFLLRKFGSGPDVGQKSIIEMLSTALERRGGRKVGERLSRPGGMTERVRIAMLKYLLHAASRPSAETTLSLEEFINKRFWRQLSRHVSPPLFRKLIGFARMRTVPPLAAVVQPIQKNGRWRRSLVQAELLLSPSQLDDQRNEFFEPLASDYEVLIEAAKTDGASLSPVFTLTTDEPPDPDCCRYRDFSRGIAEPVWVEPKPPVAPVRQLLSIASASNDTDPILAHSYLRLGPVSSIRLDYGFLCTMVGRRRPVSLVTIAIPETLPNQTSVSPEGEGK